MESNMENNIRFLIQREILLYFLNKGTAHFAMKEINNGMTIFPKCYFEGAWEYEKG